MGDPPPGPPRNGQRNPRSPAEEKFMAAPQAQSGQEPQSNRSTESDLRAWLQACGCLLVLFNAWYVERVIGGECFPRLM